MRVTNAPAHRQKVRKIKRANKGMARVRRSNLKMGKQAQVRALEYAYRDRRNKKRDFRSLWITRINNAARTNGTTYKEFMAGLKKAKIELNRKVLAELAVNEPVVFTAIVKKAK